MMFIILSIAVFVLKLNKFSTGKRQVLDKSYFVGLLRMKANDLNMEINRLNKELEKGEKARLETTAYEKK